MAEELGVAVLRVTADTREALAALEVLRNAVSLGVGGNFDKLFDGLEDSARKAGGKAGNALAQSFKQATRTLKGETDKLKFTTGVEALNFDPKNTVKGLREYASALQRLFDTTELGSAESRLLADRIGAVEAAIARAKQTTAQATDTQRQFNAALAQAQRLRLKEQSAQAGNANVGGAAGGAGSPAGTTQEATRATNALLLLQEQLTRLQNYPINIDSKSLSTLSDEARIVKKEVNDFVRAVINGDKALANNVAGLQQQARAFTVLAANAKATGSSIAEFTNFTQAAAKALQRELFTGFDQIDALRKLFALGNLGGQDSFKGTQELLDFRNNFEATPASINLYISALEQAKNVTGLSKDAFQQLTAEIVSQRAALDAATRSAEAFARIQQLTTEQRKAVADSFIQASRTQGLAALPSSELLADRVRQSGGRQPVRLAADTTNLVNNAGLAEARRFTAEIDARARAEETNRGYVEQQRDGYADLQRKASELLNIDLQRVQALRQMVVRLREEQQARESLRSSGSSFGQASGTNFGDADPVQKSIRRNREKQARRQAVQEDLRQTLLDDLARQREERIAAQRRSADLRRRRSDAAGSALIGGAFPLLFGQGLGASIGGGLGGLSGGALGGQFGFGLSLVGTAVGAQFDQASQKLQTLGSALNDPIGKFGELQQAGLLSSKGLESQIQALIDTGREAEAAALVQKDLTTTYGDLQAASALAKQTDELNRSWTRLTVTLADLGISPLVPLLGETSNAVQGFAVAIKTLRDVLPNLPTPFGTPKEIGQNLTSQRGITGGLARFAGDYAKSFQRVLFSNALLPGSGIDTVLQLGSGLGQLFGANKPATSSAADAKQANSAKIRQDVLQVQRQLVAAEAQGNKQASVRLKLSEIDKRLAQEKDKILASQFAKDKQANTKAQQVRIQAAEEAAASERARVQEATKAGFGESQRELNRQSQLVGVYGAQRQILENQLKLAEEKRLVDQAQKDFDQGGQTKAEQDALNGAILRYRAQELQITQQISQIEDQRWANAIAAANQLKGIQEQTAIELARPGLTGTGVGALQSVAALREAQRQEQNAQAQLRVQPGDEGLYNAAVQASAQVKLAAAKTRADLLDAFQSAQKAVRNISLSLSEAKTGLAALQNSSKQGLGQFLSPQLNAQRQAEVARDLQPLLKQAVNSVRGLRSITFRGPNQESVNNQVIGFINAALGEQRALNSVKDLSGDLEKANNDLSVVNQALVDSTTTLADINDALSASIDALVDKDWGVYVNVDSQGGVSTYGDVLNGALS